MGSERSWLLSFATLVVVLPALLLTCSFGPGALTLRASGPVVASGLERFLANEIGASPLNSSSVGGGAPTALSGIPYNDSALLTWVAPVGPAVSNYSIYEAPSTSGPWSPFGTSTTTTFNATGLTDGLVYFFHVRANSADGPSNNSSTIYVQPLGVPYPATDVAASAINSTSINVSWLAPTNDGGSPVSIYTIQYATDPQGPWDSAPAAALLQGTILFLSPGTTYYLRVVATNIAGTGNPSVVVSARTHSSSTGAGPTLGGTSLPVLDLAVLGAAVVVADVALVLVRRVMRRSASSRSFGQGSGSSLTPWARPSNEPGAVGSLDPSSAAAPSGMVIRTPSRPRRTWIFVGVALVVILAVVLGLSLRPTPASGTVLAPTGTQWGIAPSSFNSLEFSTAKVATITGSFTSSADVDVYVVTESQVFNASHTGNESSFSPSIWTSGLVPSGSFRVNVGSGAWAVVFCSPSPTQSTHVTITQAVEFR
jgi:hypothetical protein